MNAWQQMTLEKLPVVLILHLKWFGYNGDCTKILKTVEFPIELKIDTSKLILTRHTFLQSHFDRIFFSETKLLSIVLKKKNYAEILSSKKYTVKQKQYRLFAVVYHDGKEASKGHYITDVYHTGYLNWIRYDDSTVKRVSEKSVLHPHSPRVPYLLYYRRSDTLQTPPTAANSNANSSQHK